MAFCRVCGKELEEGQPYCTGCGVPPTPEAESVDIKADVVVEEKKAELNVGLLVWSIINLVCCNQIAGIIALIFTILAKNETPEKSKSYNKASKIINLIGTILGALIMIIIIVIYVLLIVAAIGAGTSEFPGYYY